MTAMRRDALPEGMSSVDAGLGRDAVQARGVHTRAEDGRPASDEGPLPDPARVDPGVLSTLLARHGWQRRGGAPGRYARWTPPDDLEPDTSLLVPADRGFEDSADLLEEAVAALSRSGVPSARAILASLLVPGDEIHWRRDVPGVGGAVPWGAEEELRAAASAMLSAAAKAGHSRAAYFGARLDNWAADFLDRVLVVATGTGAGMLTAYTAAPDDRPTTTTLVRALEVTRDAIDLQRATGRPDAFDDGVRLGVSRELIASVVQLVRGSEGAEIALSWAASVGPPRGFVNRRLLLEFSPGDLPVLEAAAERLEHSEPAVAVELTGAVVRLKRAVPGGEGQIRLRVLTGADVDEVKVRLGEDDYRTAVEAHLGGVPLRLRGRLERKGGFRRLADPCGVEAVELDAAERDRLLKALRLRSGRRPEPDDAEQ